MTQGSDWRGTVGDVWAEEWRHTDQAFADLTRRLDAAILGAAPAEPFRAFDIGCGAGSTSLALAEARPDADVIAVDLSDALIGVARARAHGLSNIRFATDDASAAAFGIGPFDLFYSRHGVMFFDQPTAAFASFHAAATPGARLVFSCFADPDATAFAGPLSRALGLPAPAPDSGPGPFAFAKPAVVADVLSHAGWRDARHEPIDFTYRVGAGPEPLDDAVRYLSRIGPAAAAMRVATPDRRKTMAKDLRMFLADYANDFAVDLPAAAWLWSATA